MKIHNVLLGFVVLSAASLARADVTVSGVIRIGDAPPPPVLVVEPAQPGPPPWAPAHGRRAKHLYYYYPGFDVYYRPADRTWMYLDGGHWRVGVRLPSSVRIDVSRGISLEMDTDRPYLQHKKVQAYYPPSVVDKAKKRPSPPVNDHGSDTAKANARGDEHRKPDQGTPDHGKPEKAKGKKGKGR